MKISIRSLMLRMSQIASRYFMTLLQSDVQLLLGYIFDVGVMRGGCDRVYLYCLVFIGSCGCMWNIKCGSFFYCKLSVLNLFNLLSYRWTESVLPFVRHGNGIRFRLDTHCSYRVLLRRGHFYCFCSIIYIVWNDIICN